QRFDNTEGNRTRLTNVVRSLPYLPVHDPTTNGGYRNANNSIDGADPTNPVEDALLLGQAHSDGTKLLGSAYIDAEITDWLHFRSTFGLDYFQNFQHQFSPIFDDKGRSATVATIDNIRDTHTTLLFTQQLTLDKTFGKHHINAVAVYEQQGTNSLNETSSGNQATNEIETLAGATNVSHETTESENLLISYVGRLNYDYDEKYLVSLAIRRDGLSIWAPGNKWANFPSGSIGWRIDRENFMRDQDLFSELKIRGGYGITGLNGLLIGNNYPWQVRLQANGATYPFNNENDIGNASYYNALGNPNMGWEKTSQLNIGLDVGLLDNRIRLTAEYYQRHTDNLLLEVPTPTSFGYNGGGVLANVGEMENKGFDVQLGYHKRAGEFSWNATGLISIVSNEVVALNTPNAVIGAGGDQDFGGGEDITRTEAGHPIQSFYGYVVDGIFQSNQEVSDAPTQSNAAPGDLRFKDLNDDGVINPSDRTYIGSYIPDFSYSLNLNANYKGFDLSLFLQGVQGNDIFNANRIIREGMARLFGAGTEVLDAWTPENTDTDMPRAVSGDPNQNVRPSTRWIEDGSYLRLKNIQLGYNVPVSSLNALTNGTINNLRIYVSSQNLLTITGYEGWDPEIGSKNTTLTNGIDYGQYPAARSFLLGLQVGL
ncbi:MAG TPA: SusC/RagA family TonB-linked outer membrane protein, partial [Fodinibius sp.]|nr:SusC/RagA family TonB-linked outer membrane protein [Fodinibius sp.]